MLALWLENNQIDVRDIPQPTKPGEALIKIRRAGICSAARRAGRERPVPGRAVGQGVRSNQRGLSLRYVGSLVADFHRTLISGGVFYYPADHQDPKKPAGKLRLVYEANPLAFLARQAGGAATDGRANILDMQPESLHKRTPLFIGSRALVQKAAEFIEALD